MGTNFSLTRGCRRTSVYWVWGLTDSDSDQLEQERLRLNLVFGADDDLVSETESYALHIKAVKPTYVSVGVYDSMENTKMAKEQLYKF
ncbi:hypothetical protein F442_12031 [Phytophthora nicotianae P10297]|uniref:Uncharacterized protein n=3 Tax=Phytophthora nicotianae TaxID=4792 RepID=W2Z0V3_PHYNI|nr:hypothetical protein L915_14906 [Phytophthora nicotianae]ETL36242.1 hypothetical protein L916_11759 [Phytophthora nicotianae]ETL89464.1 hypothetical protein L917_11617 [Phytophthora nicotianae]ETP40685.1 hypothetical protein F442_12031 [Phytophthora nicotianae P10297]